MLVADDRVLISRWVDGVPLSRVMADGARPDRDRAGELLLRLFASSLVHVRRLHADPHPGNFRLMADGRLAVLDFGATENTPQGWPARLGPLLAAGRDGDAAELQRITAEAGPLQPASVSSDAFMSLFEPDLDPLRTPAYRCTRGWLQEQTRRASDPLSAASCTQRRLLHPAPAEHPAAHLLLQRVATGLVGVLCSLGATVAVSDEVRRWLLGCDSGPGRRSDDREPGGAAQRVSWRHREWADPPSGDRANIAATAPPSRSLLR